MAQDLSTATQHLTFRVGEQHLALAIASVREVARMPRIARVPHAPPALLGLANFRGTVIPVLSGAALHGETDGSASRLIVFDTGELVGLAVDGADQVHATDFVDVATLVDGAALIARAMPERAAPRRSRAITTAPDPGQDADHATTTLVIFAIGDQEFALPAGAVDGIAPLPADIALLPDADDVVIGSGSFGDAVLPLLSLRALLALPRSAPSTRPRVVFAQIGNDRVGLVVDAMRGVVQVAGSVIDRLPQALRRGAAEARIQAIARLDHGNRLVSVLAADHLLRGDVTAAMKTDTRAQREAVAPVAATPTEQFLVVRIGPDEFAIPLGAVEEVAQVPETLAKLPNAPEFVLGVMTIRGQPIPVIDQSRRFGHVASAGARRRVIALRIGEVQAAFVVDAIVEVARIDAAALQPAPDLGTSETRVFERVANLEHAGRMILVIGPRALLDAAEHDLLFSLTRQREAGKKSLP